MTKVSSKKIRIYFALGGGLIAQSRVAGNPVPTEQYKDVQPAPGAFPALKSLIKKLGSENVYIVALAKTSQREQQKRAWIRDSLLCEKTGLNPGHIYMVRTRRTKASIYKKLHLNAAVEDVIEPLTHLRSNGKQLLIAYRPADLDNYKTRIHAFHISTSWRNIIATINQFRRPLD